MPINEWGKAAKSCRSNLRTEACIAEGERYKKQ